MKKLSNVVPIREAYSTGLQPSMSRSDILIECSYAFGKETEHEESREAARYGSAFHALLADRITDRPTPPQQKLAFKARVLEKWGVKGCVEEIMPHVDVSFSTLQSWLKKNEFRINFTDGAETVEEAVALMPLVSGRQIEPHDEDHRYHGLTQGELPGTLDYLNEARKKTAPRPILLLDHKTGEEDFSRPLDKPQLLSLAAAVMRWRGSKEIILGALHARRRGMPKVYAEKVKLSELKQYEGRLHQGVGRIGDGSLKPGPHCKWCPARPMCPAQDAELLSKAGDVLTGLTAAGGALSQQGLTANDVSMVKVSTTSLSRSKQIGVLYDIVRLAEKMAARIRVEIKKEILANLNLLPETPQGEYLTVRTYEKEAVSKSSIIEAYGKIAGGRKLAQLREDGAIKKSTVEQLWPEKEHGR